MCATLTLGARWCTGRVRSSHHAERNSGSVLSLNSTKALGFSVEGWFAFKKGIAVCPSRKTSLSNAIYGNSSEFSDDVITISR